MSLRVLQMLPALFLATSAASAQSPFIGAWKLDPAKSRMPDEMKVSSKGGDTYVFDFGGSPETIVADGSDQPGFDGSLLSVQQTAADTWIVRRKKGGRLWIEATWKLSDHDSTLADAYRQFEPDGSTVSMDYVYRRAGDGSGIAADWQSVRETMNSPFELHVKAIADDGLSFVSPMGTTNATFEDAQHPSHDPNPPQGAAKTIRRIDDRSLLLTIKHGDSVAATEDVVLSSDRKILTLTIHIAGHARPNVLVFERE